LIGPLPAIWSTGSTDETRQVGRELARSLEGGDIVLLHGDLGAGKTTLTKGIADGLGVSEEIQSPTFTMVAEYPAPNLGRAGWLVHIDLYRLSGTDDLDSIGLDELLNRDDAIVVVEWPERVGNILHGARLLVQIAGDGGQRTINATDLRSENRP
jgi:tRNA threonylcarbamoyladenosine biosynthesis protein TsaE